MFRVVFSGERLIICFGVKLIEILIEIIYVYYRLDFRVDVEWKIWEGNLCFLY